MRQFPQNKFGMELKFFAFLIFIEFIGVALVMEVKFLLYFSVCPCYFFVCTLSYQLRILKIFYLCAQTKN